MRKPPFETRSIREAAVPRGVRQTAKPPAPTPRAPQSTWARVVRTVLLVLPAIACTATLVIVVRRPAELCRQWEQQARSADGRAAEELTAQLDRYGRFGLPALVRLLRAESKDAVAAACRRLTARLENLQQGADDEDRAALAVIAAELSATFHHIDTDAPRETVDFALALMATTGRLGLEEQLDVDLRARLFAACEDVLRHAPPPPVDSPALPLAALIPAAPLPAVAATPSRPEPIVAPTPVATTAKLPTAVPMAVEAPPPPAPLTAANSAARIPVQPEPSPDAAVRLASLPAPPTRAVVAADNLSRDALLRADAWMLFTALRGPDRATAAAELRRRGFSQRELELGEHLTSNDPQERRRFARELPSLDVTESMPWLLRLCRDEDAEVRLIAVTIMATTNDPAVQERLRQLSIDDVDDEVRRTAARATGRTQR